MANKVPTFTIVDIKLYVPVLGLSFQDNAKLLQQLKSGFKRTINWNKYQSKTTQAPNQYLDYLTDLSFQGVNRLFVLSYENTEQLTSSKRCFLPTVEIKDYNVMMDGRNFFDQPLRYDLSTWLLTRLFLFKRKLEPNCNRSK